MIAVQIENVQIGTFCGCCVGVAFFAYAQGFVAAIDDAHSVIAACDVVAWIGSAVGYTACRRIHCGMVTACTLAYRISSIDIGACTVPTAGVPQAWILHTSLLVADYAEDGVVVALTVDFVVFTDNADAHAAINRCTRIR